MQQDFIFGAGTGKAYSDIKRMRDIAEQFTRGATETPRTGMEGLNAIAKALIARTNTRKADKAQEQLLAQIGPDSPLAFALMGIPQTAVPKYRYGTNFHPGGPAIVGEDGPELMMMPRGAQVVPNPATIAQNPGMVPEQIGPQGGDLSGMVQMAEAEGGTATDALPYGDTKLTEGQSKDVGYFRRGYSANQELEDPKLEAALLQFTDNFAGNFGGVGRLFQDAEYQKGMRAANEFLAMVLRKDTGAAVTNQEFELYGPMYIPMPGDKPELLAAKRNARSQFLKGLEMGSGTAAPLFNTARQEIGEMSDDDLLRALGGGN
jgi:hypothetical protein